MKEPSLKLLLVRCRSTELRRVSGDVGGVRYECEQGGPSAIYITLRMASWRHSIEFPQRDDAEMKITGAPTPFSRSVGFEFCGSKIDELLAAVQSASNVNQVVLSVSSLLHYVQDNFTSIR